MNKKTQVLLGILILLLQVIVNPLVSLAQSTPSGEKSFAPVGAKNGSWNDGIPLGGSYLHIDDNGIITGFAKDSKGNDWNGQKFKNITDNAIAYCLNFDQATPDGSSQPLDNLTPEQKRQLNNLLKLGYVEHGTNVYKGQGVATLSNIDAFTTTQWMVHKIVPTWDMDSFTITNPQLAAGVANLSNWIQEDLSIKLVKIGGTEEVGDAYSQEYSLTAPHALKGNATITLDKDITGAKIVSNEGTFDVSTTLGHKVNVGESFKITVPKSTATDKINVIAKGGTTSFTFMKYDRPAPGQQQALVVGEESIGDDEISKADMEWETLIPEIGTTATDKSDGDKTLDPDKQVTINDEVRYSGLTPGKTYTVNGTLMDKSTGKPLEVNGQTVTGTTTFTAEKSEGTVNVEFTFDASALKGKTIVVFEKAYQGDKEVATHEDINDGGQTVDVTDPKIGTTATDKSDGDKTLDPDKQVTINDEVRYSGLTPGKSYTVNGTLMDKSTGKPLEVNGQTVTGTTTFTAEKSEGTVNVEFTFDASALKGKTIVVFEKAYQGDKEVATHEDINDGGQTVDVKNPENPTPPTPGGTDDNKLPDTGEHNSIIMLMVGMLIIIVGGISLTLRKKMK